MYSGRYVSVAIFQRVIGRDSNPLLQLFKVFRALWQNPDDDSFGENVTVQYFRRYIKDTGAKSRVRYSGDCSYHLPSVQLNANFVNFHSPTVHDPMVWPSAIFKWP